VHYTAGTELRLWMIVGAPPLYDPELSADRRRRGRANLFP